MRTIKIVVLLALITFTSCNGTTTQQNADTTQSILSDSMPVVKPTIIDTKGVIKTPPVNDNNVIVPDTNQLNK